MKRIIAARRLKASPKARKMWAHVEPGLFHVIHADERLRMRSMHDMIPDYIPVFVLPGSREDVERMVETFMAAMASVPQPQAQEDHVGPSWEESKVIAGFASIGIRSRKDRK